MRRILLAVPLVVIVGCGSGHLEGNKEIARSYLQEVLLEQKWDQWDRYFLDSVSYNGVEVDREMIRQHIGALHNALPDLQLIIEDQVAEGDKVLTRLTFTGTHTGDFVGIPGTDNRVVYRGLALDRIIDGKVVEMWHVTDTWAMLQQMGIR